MADHIFDPSLVARMGNVQFGDRTGVAFCLMESDTKNLVGLASSSVKLKLNKTDLDNLRVKEIDNTMDISVADGVDAGMFAVDATLFERMEGLAQCHAYFTLSDVLRTYAEEEKLFPVKTDELMWFSCETRESLSHGVNSG